jgi:uncharacterized protein (DUF362 family)
MTPSTKPTVILRACPTYDVARIQTIVREGLETLDLRPHGRTLVKPNVVNAGPKFPHAFTRPEFMEGVLRALRARAGPDLEELAVGERCGITVPTRFAYKGAGYYDLARRTGVKLYHFDEVPQVEVPLYHPQRLRDSIFTPQPVAKADFFVNCPKFKAHPWTTVTFSMKNYIGIQDDRHRLIDHDHKLDEKVADLQYIVQPQLIVIDAITAGEGRMLTPIPFDMGLVILGNNQVAFDAVCCQVIGVDPRSVPHIRLAHERGFGPVDLERITLAGDVTLDEARRKASGFKVGLIRVEDYFKGSRLRAYAGPPPGGSGDDYCWGGCPGALEEAIEILRLFDTNTDDLLPNMHLVFGNYQGEIPANPDEKVVFVGDCATWGGDLAGKPVRIDSRYRDRSLKSPHQAEHSDIFAKIGRVALDTWWRKKEQVLRMPGCPVSVAEQVLLLARLAGAKNPYLDPQQATAFTSCYLSWRTRNLARRIFGEPYQVAGPTERGSARPPQNLPRAGEPAPLERMV